MQIPPVENPLAEKSQEELELEHGVLEGYFVDDDDFEDNIVELFDIKDKYIALLDVLKDYLKYPSMDNSAIRQDKRLLLASLIEYQGTD